MPGMQYPYPESDDFAYPKPDVCGLSACSKKPEKLLTCSVCREVYYCSETCQRLAWKRGHKKICARLAEMEPKGPSPSVVRRAIEEAEDAFYGPRPLGERIIWPPAEGTQRYRDVLAKVNHEVLAGFAIDRYTRSALRGAVMTTMGTHKDGRPEAVFWWMSYERAKRTRDPNILRWIREYDSGEEFVMLSYTMFQPQGYLFVLPAKFPISDDPVHQKDKLRMIRDTIDMEEWYDPSLVRVDTREEIDWPLDVFSP